MKKENRNKKTYDGFNYSKKSIVEESAVAYKTKSYSSFGEYAILRVVRDGISFKEFENVRKRSGMSLQEWADFLNISERTLMRYSANDENLDKVTSERTIEIAMLHERGAELFGSFDSFNKWMNSEIRTLNFNKPKAFLDSSFGIQILRNQLGRIEHGIPS